MPASILIVDDESKMGKALKHVLVKEGYDVESIDDPASALDLLAQRKFQVLLCDLKMPTMSGLDVLERSKAINPDLNVIMMTAYASAETAVESMKKGAYDYLIKPFAMDELKILLRRCLDEKDLKAEIRTLKEQLRGKFSPSNIVSVSKVMQSVLSRGRKVAESNSTVLITGESGTGKEMLARMIHESGLRRDRPMVAVNCGALPEPLLEAELFGHRRGAFTGAVEDRCGLFELADKGTIFLDEIADVTPAMQVRLLRVLQSGEFQRVGNPATVRVDVRVIAATNKVLEKLMAEDTFRSDLYYRLNVVPIHIPPLRERREDIIPLIDHFTGRFGEGRNWRFTSEALDVMEAYDWPGNIRELENAVEHAIVLADAEELGVESLPMALRSFAGSAEAKSGSLRYENRTLEEVEKLMIQSAMAAMNNNMTRAAQRLGITRRTLGYRLRKYGLYNKQIEEMNLDDSEGEDER